MVEDSVGVCEFVYEVSLNGSGVHGGGDGDDGGGGEGDLWAEEETQETKVSPGGRDLSGQSPLPD